MEEILLGTDAPMVARARLLEPLEVRVEVGLGVERRAVDPRELRVLLVAAPVGPGEARELERLDRRAVLEMRPTTEIGEGALRVQRDRSFRALGELDLVRLVLCPKALDRLVARNLLSNPDAPFLDLPAHLVLDRFEIGFRDRLRELEVVVEAVRDRRPDRNLDAGIEPHRGLREQVRGRMPKDVERVGIVRLTSRHELDPLPVLHRKTKVLSLAVRSDEDGLLGELRPDRARRVEPRGAVGQLELGGVGQQNLHRARG